MIDIDNGNIDDEIMYVGPDGEFIARQWVTDSAARAPEIGETVSIDTNLHGSHHKGQMVVGEVWHNLSKYNRRVEVYLEVPDP